MNKVVFVTSPFIEINTEFVGVDGEIYHIYPNAKLIIPELNAKVLEKQGLGKIIAQYQEPKKSIDELFEEQINERADPFEILNTEQEDPIKEWAKWALQVELNKPSEQQNPDRIIELRMIINGSNPAQFLYKSEDTKEPQEETINLAKPSTRSGAPCPTGLCSPFNTVQAKNSDVNLLIRYRPKIQMLTF